MEGRKIVFSRGSSVVRLPLDGGAQNCFFLLFLFCSFASRWVGGVPGVPGAVLHPSILQFIGLRSGFVRSSLGVQPRKRGAFYGQKSHQDTRRPGDQDTAPPRGWWCIYVFGLKLLIMLYLHFNRPTFHALAALPQTRRGGRVWAWLGVGVAGCGCGSILGGVALYWGVYIYRGV